MIYIAPQGPTFLRAMEIETKPAVLNFPDAATL